MKLYIKNHSFHYEMEKLLRIFFPNEKIDVLKYEDIELIEEKAVITELGDSHVIVKAVFEDFFEEKKVSVYDLPEKEQERTMAVTLFKLLSKYTGVKPMWGILTGIRPIKLFRYYIEEHGHEYAINYFKDKFLVSEKKLNIIAETEKNEKKIIELSKKSSFSLYVSIPFCPTRCSYCSFVSQTVTQANHLIEPYVNLLVEELMSTAELANKIGLRLETVYIGGGTPTTLEAQQLRLIIDTIHKYFNTESLREFTVEAGRPDTITSEKLHVLSSTFENCSIRISINPQTLNNNVLENIGRKHTAEQVFLAYELARKAGINNINMDLIAGLPGDTYESFDNTVSNIIDLNPESITIHTLSMKRSSYITESGLEIYKKDAVLAEKMLELGESLLTDNGYLPYYLYRQSKMVGNLENVGWAKKGFESLYNVYIMDETHTILGCGAGAVTKLKNPNGAYLERIFNYKYPYEYISRFEEMLKRKERYEPFYEEVYK